MPLLRPLLGGIERGSLKTTCEKHHLRAVKTPKQSEVRDSLPNEWAASRRRYFWMTPQAMRSPELPDGSLIKSSAFA